MPADTAESIAESKKVVGREGKKRQSKSESGECRTLEQKAAVINSGAGVVARSQLRKRKMREAWKIKAH
jgi:hypothetical protein